MAWEPPRKEKDRVKGILSSNWQTYIKEPCGFAGCLRRSEHTLQYIEMVLAQDMMNPLWVFSMGVELKYELIDSTGQPVFIVQGQDGSDRKKDYRIRLHAPGSIGEQISAMIRVNTDGGLGAIPDRDGGLIPGAAEVVLQRVTSDTSSSDYNLFTDPLNRPIIFTPAVTLAAMVGVPSNAIVLADNTTDHVVIAETCKKKDEPGKSKCISGIPVWEDIKAANPTAIELGAKILVRDGTLVFDIGHDCGGTWDSCDSVDLNESTFNIEWGTKVGEPATNLLRVRIPTLASSMQQINNENNRVIWKTGELIGTRVYSYGSVAPYVELLDIAPLEVGTEQNEPYAVFSFKQHDTGKPPPYLHNNNSNNGKLGVPNQPYFIVGAFLHAKFVQTRDLYSGLPSSKISYANFADLIYQDKVSVIMQEYFDHHMYKDPKGRRINCTSSRCRTFHPWPTANDFEKPILTAHYSQNGGCGFQMPDAPDTSNCEILLASNYYDPNGTNYTMVGHPLQLAEETWNFYQNIMTIEYLLPPVPYNPIVTSGWRNPERNEYFSPVINSDHQWGAGLDIDLEADNIQQVYDSATPNAAPLNWCRLAKAAWEAGGTKQTIVENGRGTAGIAYMFLWSNQAVIDQFPNLNGIIDEPYSCVDNVRERIEACLRAGYPNVTNNDYTPDQRKSCSPNHVHTAKP